MNAVFKEESPISISIVHYELSTSSTGPHTQSDVCGKIGAQSLGGVSILSLLWLTVPDMCGCMF